MEKFLSGIFVFVTVILLPSCTYYFQLDDVAESPKLVMYSYPGSGDTTIVRLSRSMPVSAKGAIVSGLRSPDIRCTVNGTPVSLQWTTDSLPGVPAGSHYLVTAYRDGDCVEFTASVEGLKAVSAATVIPVSFPLLSVEMKRKSSEPSTLQFLIRFKDEASRTDYYAVKVEKKLMYWKNGVYSEERYLMALELKDEPLLDTFSGLDEMLLPDKEFYQNLYFWDDEKIQGKEYTLRLNTSYGADYETDYEWGEEKEHVVCKKQYRISLYSLSEECYRYLKSLNDQHSNQLTSSELAPIRPTYTNVRNGLGLVGGCRLMQTDWMDNLKED